MNRTLFSRFLSRFILISLISLLVLAVISLAFLRAYETRREGDYLQARTRMIAELISAVMRRQTPMQEMNRQLRAIRSNEGLNVYLMTNEEDQENDEQQQGGQMHGQSSMSGPHRGIRDLFQADAWMETEILALIGPDQLGRLAEEAEETTLVSVRSRPFQMPILICALKTENGLLLVYRSPSLTGDAVSSRMPLLYTVLLLSFLLVGLISIGVMAGMYRRLLKPFREMTQVADGILAGQYDRRIADYPEMELQAIAESVNRMVEKLSRLESVRLDFTAQLAHEMRTPLTILRMSLQGVLDGVIQQDEMPEFFRQALQETQRLEQLTRDLIDLAIAEGDAFPLELEQTDISRLIASVETEMMPLIRNQNQQLQVSCPPVLEGSLDPKRIRQVLINLLSNSSKFAGENKQIELQVRHEGGLLKFTVYDNGPGIPPEEQELLFEKYRKWGKKAGAGLGLAIAKTIIEAHGGSITVDSDGRTYTRFSGSIPI